MRGWPYGFIADALRAIRFSEPPVDPARAESSFLSG
jgi:hypothetical protein